VKTVSNETFKMYVMFLPPGGKSQYVPLLFTQTGGPPFSAYIQWSWTGTATWDGMKWNLTGAGQSAGPGGTSTNIDYHPIWTQNVQAGEFVPD
jgi:hypothetical protein